MSEIPEEAALQNALSQEARMFRSSQEAEGASGASHQDTSPVVMTPKEARLFVWPSTRDSAAGRTGGLSHWLPFCWTIASAFPVVSSARRDRSRAFLRSLPPPRAHSCRS